MEEVNCSNEFENSRDDICVNVQKIYDTCKDKDCLADMRVYFSQSDQVLIDKAVNVKARNSEIICSYVDLEAVPFNKGFYSVDITFFFKTEFEVYTGCGRPAIVRGLSSYDKKVILYGSEGSTTTYSSKYNPLTHDSHQKIGNNQPIAQVEVVDPIVLSTRIVEPKKCCCGEIDIASIPNMICSCFDGPLTDVSERTVSVTLGLFSIVRILRDVQVVIPASKFCLPEKECHGPSEEEPCTYFEKLCFPTNEFFPPEFQNGCGK